MAYSENTQRYCLLPVAAAMAVLFLLAMVAEVAAQGKRGCPAGYQRTKQGCVKEANKAVKKATNKAVDKAAKKAAQSQSCGTNEVRRGRQCVCVEGYTRKDGKCVSQTAQPCGANEVRRGRQCVCADGYTRKDGACVSQTACGANEIRRGRQCVCMDGYTRKDGKCVSQAACGTNEVRRGRQCACVDGYTRKDGKCVSQTACGANEVRRGRQCVCADGYTRKDGACVSQTACGSNEVRRGRQCVCVDGYTRKDGTCVSQTACGANEVRRGQQCVCAEGYRRKDGACVSQTAQPSPPVTPPVRWVLPPRQPPAPGQLAQAPTRKFVPGQLILGFKSAEEVDKAIAQFERMQSSGGLVTQDGVRSTSVRVERRGDKNLKLILDPRTSAGTRPTGADELKVLEEYANQLSQGLGVEYAHPNWILMQQQQRPLNEPVYLGSPPKRPANLEPSSLPSGPSDPAYRDGLLWHYLPPPVGMNAVGAWAKTTGSRDIVVAVLDTGILPQHPDIKDSGNLLPGYDFTSIPSYKADGLTGWDADPTDPGDQCPDDGRPNPSWHGTHVAGTIGAATANNGIGIAGVNWAVSVLPVRVLGRCGSTIDDIVAAIQWSSGLDVPGVPKNGRKADIINMSLGGDLPCTPPNVGFLIDALTAARKLGVTVVVAAGNNSSDVKNFYPAGCGGVISVAASDRRGRLANYSNFGNVTIMAPGGGSDATDEQGAPNQVLSLLAPTADHPDGMGTMSGTSMAAPHVSAAIALALSVKPGLRGKPDEIERLLTRSAAPRPAGACAVPCGVGLLDAQKMVEPGVVTTGTGR